MQWLLKSVPFVMIIHKTIGVTYPLVPFVHMVKKL